MRFSGRKAYQMAKKRLKESGVEGAEKASSSLIAHAMGWDQIRFLLSLSSEEPEVEWERIEPLLARREKGEPLQYILGEASFYGYSFSVTPAVLIPRPETELLVERALLESKRRGWENKPLRLLDLGVGSGAILLSLLKERPRWEGWGIDLSQAALAVAAKNADRLEVSVRFHAVQGDMRDAASFLPAPFTLLLSNPPYIPSKVIPTLQKEVSAYEPHGALDGGEDGLSYYRAIANQIPELLFPDGLVLLEVGIGQAEEVAELLGRLGGVKKVETVKDPQGIDRILVGER